MRFSLTGVRGRSNDGAGTHSGAAAGADTGAAAGADTGVDAAVGAAQSDACAGTVTCSVAIWR